ncbi:MAG: T9SS type A sorting domain-containing protein [Chitinophagaceae bacterium]
MWKTDSVTITESGDKKELAWCGGFNNPQFSLADLNNDGLSDLVVYFPDQPYIKTFLNFGTASHPNYRYRPQYAKNFPICNNYLIMRDYDRDGIMDLFHSGGVGFTAYKGYYNGSNELCFSLYKGLYYNNDKKTIGWVNAEVNPGDIPSIVDVDNDGDLDFLSYYGDGYYMNWYQNMQVENGYATDSITIRLADHCWGKMIQGVLRTHTLGIYCDNSALSRTTDDGGTSKITDGGNAPCLLDMDGDGDYDVLDGHRAFDYVVYLENSKAATGLRDSMVYQDTAWTTLGDTVKIAQWAAVFHLDIDQDGNRDLLVSPNGTGGSEDYRCVRFYRNIASDSHPSFKFESDSLFTSEMIDVGSGAYPFFYDYNRDGKPDLFVGNKGYYEKSTGLYIGSVMYLENTSTPGNPSFSIMDRNFLNLQSKRFRGISVGIGDVDNDGKDDFVMGHTNGYVDYIKNTAVSASARPIWNLSSLDTVRDFVKDPVSCNGTAVPVIYDMNADGVKDIVLGDQSGYLYYYQNASTTAGSSSFVFTNDQLGFAKVDPEKVTVGNSAPFIGKIDNTGRDYLLVGSRSGRLFRFSGFEGGAIFGYFTRLDSAYSNILSQNYRSSSFLSAPAVADIDGDGKYEMVVGNTHGGLFFYKQDKTVSIGETAAGSRSISIYPNPAGQQLFIHQQQTKFPQHTSVIIYNTLGQEVARETNNAENFTISISVAKLTPGFYYCQIDQNGVQTSIPFIKQ